MCVHPCISVISRFDYNYRKIIYPAKFLSLNSLPSVIIEFRDSKEDDDESCSPRIEGRLALPPRMVIDADRERSVNRKLGVRSDKYAALRRAAVDSARLDSIRLESARGGGESKFNTGIEIE